MPYTNCMYVFRNIIYNTAWYGSVCQILFVPSSMLPFESYLNGCPLSKISTPSPVYETTLKIWTQREKCCYRGDGNDIGNDPSHSISLFCLRTCAAEIEIVTVIIMFLKMPSPCECGAFFHILHVCSSSSRLFADEPKIILQHAARVFPGCF